MSLPQDRQERADVGPEQPLDLQHWILHVEGLVSQPLTLSLDDLAALDSEMALVSDVTCPDRSIGIAGKEYEGALLTRLLRLARPTDDARYVCVHAGEFIAAFSLESLDRRIPMLAIRKHGAPLTWADGGPIRLVAAKGACFDTVKWVERISLERDASSATALSIVRARR
jgi:DMSO/TMAO reductase YedYZ molybdopterin-dependent catalytic subunit